MEKRGKWETLRELGRGGQGVTYLAVDRSAYNAEGYTNVVRTSINNLGQIHPANQNTVFVDNLVNALRALMSGPDEKHLGALKILHEPADRSGLEKARSRMTAEARVYESITHPNLLRVLDRDVENGWLVTDYQPGGTLSDHPEFYKGDLHGALVAIRPVVDAVTELHRHNAVHRDIKPANIFVGRQGQLILGDAGLAFFSDAKHSRLSDTLENVGSRDWMPAWAMGMRVDDIKPSFDVFSLGKLIWSMVSGRQVLQLWYHHRPQFELEEMFPEDLSLRWARFVLDLCIVENEKDCMQAAGDLRYRIDWAIRALRDSAPVIGDGLNFPCRACGLGVCVLFADERHAAVRNFGLDPTGNSTFKIFRCVRCGHIELFQIPDRDSGRPTAWPTKPSGD